MDRHPAMLRGSLSLHPSGRLHELSATASETEREAGTNTLPNQQENNNARGGVGQCTRHYIASRSRAARRGYAIRLRHRQACVCIAPSAPALQHPGPALSRTRPSAPVLRRVARAVSATPAPPHRAEQLSLSAGWCAPTARSISTPDLRNNPPSPRCFAGGAGWPCTRTPTSRRNPWIFAKTSIRQRPKNGSIR